MVNEGEPVLRCLFLLKETASVTHSRGRDPISSVLSSILRVHHARGCPASLCPHRRWLFPPLCGQSGGGHTHAWHTRCLGWKPWTKSDRQP